jgi:hypothetical protein
MGGGDQADGCRRRCCVHASLPSPGVYQRRPEAATLSGHERARFFCVEALKQSCSLLGLPLDLWV